MMLCISETVGRVHVDFLSTAPTEASQEELQVMPEISPDSSYRYLPAPEDITASVINSIVLINDEFSQTAALDYWDMSAAEHHRVVSCLRSAAHTLTPATGSGGELISALDTVLRGPMRLDLTRRLAELITPGITLGRGAQRSAGDPLASQQQAWRALVMQAVRADAVSRLYVHLSDGHTDAATVAAADIPARVDLFAGPDFPEPGNSRTAPGRTGAVVTVVIPFRDRSADQCRLRNMLACLSAFADQSLPRPEYRLVVVELDSEPRHAELIRQRADCYVFLPCTGHFNKAWGVNAGVVQAGSDSEILCICDGDILVDRDFLERNLSKFSARGHQAHWPFCDPLCMDPVSTDAAITRRCLMGEPEIPLDIISGVRLRQPPGACIWVRTDAFHRIGGMDERFEGWGGEDLDFAFRLNVVGPVDRFDDLLLHMFHQRPQITQDGRRFYAGRRLLTWRPAGSIGQLDAPAGSIDDDLAGLMQV